MVSKILPLVLLCVFGKALVFSAFTKEIKIVGSHYSPVGFTLVAPSVILLIHKQHHTS